MTLPSKELLLTVLPNTKRSFTRIEKIYIEDNQLVWSGGNKFSTGTESINLYEFADFCKAWAFANGLDEIKTMSYGDNEGFRSIQYIYKRENITQDFGIQKSDELSSLFAFCDTILKKTTKE